MASLFLTLIVVALLFAVFVIGGGAIAIRWIGNALAKEDAGRQWILGAGLVPPHWSRKHRRRIAVCKHMGLPPEAIARLERFAKRRVEVRLYRMIRSIERSNMIPDEGTRRETISTLRAVGRRWEASRWHEILATE